MRKEVRLKTGETVYVVERLIGWINEETYLKVQREDNSIRVIRESDFSRMLQKSSQPLELSTMDKLKLFYSYFRGRPDVYATKWKSKVGKVGFSPHGEGRWVVKDGRNKKEMDYYYPYTLETVNDHIRTEKYDFQFGAGIYPMLEDDTTYLIVMDFDSEHAEEEAKAVVKVCRNHNIDLLIERSQSGEGIHLWFFFEEANSAATARLFGQLILRHAMAEMNTLTFSSFDRIIPMQDTLPSNQFGNIIALPLRADKVKEGKTVFLNDNFEMVQDLWGTLASIKKLAKEDILGYINTLNEDLPIQFYKQQQDSLDISLPNTLKVELAGELKIHKQDISRKTMVQLAHLATIHNPEFYKLQNMRAPTWNTPQFITSASEDEAYLFLPRGIQQKLEQLETELYFTDKRLNGHAIDVSFKGKLRENQKQAVEKMLNHEMGIVSAPTGFGKTVVAANVIAQRKISTLIIVHSKVLADQWKERLSEFLDVQSEPFVEYTPTGRVRKKDVIGELHSGKENLSHNIDIALFQTLANREDLAEYLEPYGMVIIDEVHHAAAKTFEDVVRQIKARYLYGLTATPERKDGLTPILFMRLGEMIYEHEEDLAESLLIPKYFYPRFTNYSDYNPELGYVEHLNNMVTIDERNELILADVVENVEQGRSCLVLTERVEHVGVLNDLLGDALRNVPIFSLSSKQSKQKNKTSIDEMKKLDSAFIVIATSKLVGEGFDLPQLKSIFFSLPFSWKGRTNQYVGRLHRKMKEKDELRIYDYIDIGIEMFARMYQKRLKVYAKLNYQLAEDDKTRKNQTQFYTASNYEEPLKFDFTQAKKIVMGIVSIQQIRLEQLRGLNKEITLIVKEDKFRKHKLLLSELREIGIRVELVPVNPFSFITCDDKIIWYGNVKYLTKSDKDATTLRLSNKEIAQKIMKQYLE